MVTAAIEPAAWDAFVDAHPDASGYHAWAWRQVFEDAFCHETVYLAAMEGGQITGVLPAVIFRSWLFGRFMVSLPFVNYGGVLARTDAAAAALLRAAEREACARRCAHIELRHTTRLYPALPAKQHKVGMTMALAPDSETAWSRIDRKARNQVRKAQKSGLNVSSGGRELLDDFYRVFAVNMRDLGTPVYSRRFFERVVDTVGEASRVFVVRHGVEPVAVALTLRHRGAIEVPWASSLKAYRASCPNNLLYWTLVEHAIAQGCTTFDFGRSTPGEGTFEFKRQWGAVPAPLYWEYALLTRRAVPDQSPANPRYRRPIEVWKRLPLALTTAVGPRIVRSIP